MPVEDEQADKPPSVTNKINPLKNFFIQHLLSRQNH